MLPMPLVKITEDFLLQVCAEEWPESQTLEFKATMPGTKNEDREEFRKDVSALANARGGDLVFGISTVDDKAKMLLGCAESSDGAKRRLQQILETNVEAAVEVARQLRLRNIGGLVVIDLIDMRHRKDQQTVYKAIKDRLKRDKAKTQVLQISPVGLMEMTRQRLNESLRDSMYEPCPYCQGRARVKTPMTMSVEIQRRLNTVIQKHRETVGDIIVVVNTDVLNRFKSEDSKLLGELERSHSGRLIFRSDPTLNRERYAIIDAATEKTIDQV